MKIYVLPFYFQSSNKNICFYSCLFDCLLLLTVAAASDSNSWRSGNRENSDTLADEETFVSDSTRADPCPCERHRLQLNFTDIGYTWIIVPIVTDIYTCRGSCPSENTYNFSAKLRTELCRRNMTEAENCRECVPTRYEKLPILYFDRGLNVKYGNIKVIVAECGCQ